MTGAEAELLPPISPMRSAGRSPGQPGRAKRKSPRVQTPACRAVQAHIPEELITPSAAAGPGPGKYLPGQPQRPSNQAQVLFGTQKRSFQQEQTTLSPGPAYALPSCISKQAPSEQRSAPCMSFGSGSRDDTAKMYLSKEHAKRSRGDAPGAGTYQSPSSLGKQAWSIKRSLAAPSMPSATRDAGQLLYLGRDLVLPPRDAPAPGAYAAPAGLGKQASSSKETAGAFSFGTADKSKGDSERKDFVPRAQQRVLYGNNSPGPVYFHEHGTMGAAVLAGKKRATGGRGTFGSSSRFAMSSTERAISDNPGPGAYKGAAASGLGAQVRGRTAAAVSFGTSTRLHRSKLHDDAAAFNKPLGR